MEFKKIFLAVLFCYNVGENGLELKARYGSLNVPYRKCKFLSVNELIEQTYLCVVNSGKKYKVKCSRIITALHHVDLVRLLHWIVIIDAIVPLNYSVAIKPSIISAACHGIGPKFYYLCTTVQYIPFSFIKVTPVT